MVAMCLMCNMSFYKWDQLRFESNKWAISRHNWFKKTQSTRNTNHPFITPELWPEIDLQKPTFSWFCDTLQTLRPARSILLINVSSCLFPKRTKIESHNTTSCAAVRHCDRRFYNPYYEKAASQSARSPVGWAVAKITNTCGQLHFIRCYSVLLIPNQSPSLVVFYLRAHVWAAGKCSVLTVPLTYQCRVARTQPAQPSGSRWLPQIWMKGGYCQERLHGWIALL